MVSGDNMLQLYRSKSSFDSDILHELIDSKDVIDIEVQ